jgi:hypothetical protein
VGWIPDKAIGILSLTNPSTQSLTEMSTRNLPGGKWRRERKANHTVIYEPPRPVTTTDLPPLETLLGANLHTNMRLCPEVD